MKTNDLPLGFVLELTSLTARLTGELAEDYCIPHSPENASKVGMLLVNVGITMMTLQSESTNDSIKKEICELIDTVDIKKLQNMFAHFEKKEQAKPLIQLADELNTEKKVIDKKNVN